MLAEPTPTTFPTLPELLGSARRLARNSEGLITWREFGESRQGEPLGLLTVGHGENNALVLAGVHPNEPVGGLTVLAMARRLAMGADFGFTWHLAVCVDPDGLRLNEGWFGAPGSRAAYEQHCFRPAPD